MKTLIAAALIAVAGATDAAEAIEVDLELVLAVDVSGSMDREEQQVQRDGYVDALRSEEVWAVIRRGAWRRVALAYLEWAGHTEQRVPVDWRLIDSRAALLAFADDLAEAPIGSMRGTSISGAIDTAAAMIAENDFDGWRRVVDVSGDGPNNRGRSLAEARAEALAQGIVLNGLPLMIRPSAMTGDLAGYYADCVIGGGGAFSIPVLSRDQLAAAIRRKLILEVSGVSPPPLTRAQSRAADCAEAEHRRFWSPP